MPHELVDLDFKDLQIDNICALYGWEIDAKQAKKMQQQMNKNHGRKKI